MNKLFAIAAIAAMPALPALAAPNNVEQFSVGSSPKTFQISPKLSTLTPFLTDSQFRLFQQTASSRGSRRLRAGSTSGYSRQAGSSSQRVSPYNYGSNCSSSSFGCISYTNARVANSTVAKQASTANQPVGGMPYVASGKLLIATTTAGSFNATCSASLIGKGLLVTAAHCVHSYGNGTAGFYKSFRFIPANNSSSNTGPYGSWDGNNVWIPTVYLNGNDVCSTRGIVCNNDVAVIVLKKNSKNQYPSSLSQIGYYAYGWNGYGFRSEGSSGTLRSMITQLGYPSGLDSANLMQRGDSYGQYTGTGTGSSPLNLIIGSQMNGGSSGGPWLINFGTASTLSGSSAGAAPVRNVVQATTSWGYTSSTIQVQGASTFAQNSAFPNASYTEGGRDYGAGNIGALVQAACGASGSNGQALGACF